VLELKLAATQYPGDGMVTLNNSQTTGAQEPTAQESEIMNALGVDRAMAAEYLGANLTHLPNPE
jgi:hypothetical protein